MATTDLPCPEIVFFSKRRNGFALSGNCFFSERRNGYALSGNCFFSERRNGYALSGNCSGSPLFDRCLHPPFICRLFEKCFICGRFRCLNRVARMSGGIGAQRPVLGRAVRAVGGTSPLFGGSDERQRFSIERFVFLKTVRCSGDRELINIILYKGRSGC